MSDQACPSGYGYIDCTPVHHHDAGLLPMTGLPIAYIAAVATATILLGALLAYLAHRAGRAEAQPTYPIRTYAEAQQELHQAAADAGAQIATALMPAMERIAAACQDVERAIERRAAKGPGHPEG